MVPFGSGLECGWRALATYCTTPVGVGPGQLRTAMDSTATLSFFQNVLHGRILTDGHNIFVEVAVTTGLLGVGLLSLWLFGVARTAARCSFLGFAVAMLAVELVQPIIVAILPLSFLSLGAATAVGLRHRDTADLASRTDPNAEQPAAILPVGERGAAPYARSRHRSPRWCWRSFVGGTMVLGDAYMSSGTDHGPGQPFNLAAARDANRGSCRTGRIQALEVAQVEAFDSARRVRVGAATLVESRHWTAIAVSRRLEQPASLDAPGRSGRRDQGVRNRPHRVLPCAVM